MFVALLMRGGRSASAVDLIEALWGMSGPASAMTTLRTYAWRLRKVLEESGSFPRILESVGDGYRLVLADEHIDVRRVEAQARAAERARGANELATAHELLMSSLSLWRGEPLAGIPGPFAARQRERFDELRLSLEEDGYATGIELGCGSGYGAEIHGLVDQFPLRERLYSLLMRVQWQGARSAQAVRRAGPALRRPCPVRSGCSLTGWSSWRVVFSRQMPGESPSAFLPGKGAAPYTCRSSGFLSSRASRQRRTPDSSGCGQAMTSAWGRPGLWSGSYMGVLRDVRAGGSAR